jgi:anti-anti-sigma factor
VNLDGVGTDLLWIERVVDNHSVVVRVAGEIDLTNASLLGTQLRLAEAVVVPPAPVVLDLEAVSFIGSAGLNALVEHHLRCVELGSRLVVVAGRRVSRVLNLSGLDEVITVTSAGADHPTGAGDGHPG